jgi:hypothetical protein
VPRISIRTLMVAIFVSAIGLAALRGGKDVLNGFLLLIAICSSGYLIMETRRVS